jgi:hypothetical protein
VGLSKDEWATVMVEGINPLEGNTIELWDDRRLTADCEIRVYFNVPLVFLELNIQKVSKGLYHLIPLCTSSVISVRYIVLAENVHSGKLVWERDPGPKDLDNRFYFQSQLPPGQRANPSAQSWGSASASRHEVLKPTSILDEDWEGAYADSDTWNPIMEQIDQSTNADTDTQGWPEGFRLIGRKLYKGVKLCVPEEYVQEIVRAYQLINVHIGVQNCSKA